MKKVLIFLALAAFTVVACNKSTPDGPQPGDPNTVTYAGVTYRTVTLDNGQTWMAENLRYVPDGAAICDSANNFDATVFYPYELVDPKFDTVLFDPAKPDSIKSVSCTGTPVVRKDEASIKKLGLLYTLNGIMGVEVDSTNFDKLEGARGICPEGWHIPTRLDYQLLIGTAPKAYKETTAPATIDTALFYDKTYKGGKVASFNAAGFNFPLVGSVVYSTYMNYQNKPISTMTSTMTEWYGNPMMTYLYTSTPVSKPALDTNTGKLKCQFVGLMTTFSHRQYQKGKEVILATSNPEGKVSMSNCTSYTAAPLRCIQDSK